MKQSEVVRLVSCTHFNDPKLLVNGCIKGKVVPSAVHERTTLDNVLTCSVAQVQKQLMVKGKKPDH